MNAIVKKSKGSGSGGPRNTGKTLSNNTSGLAGIWFQQRFGIGENPVLHTYICCAYSEGTGPDRKSKRTAFSVGTHGPDIAMMKAIMVRHQAGLPVPTMEEALKALAKYVEEANAKPRPKAPKGKAKVKLKPKEKPS